MNTVVPAITVCVVIFAIGWFIAPSLDARVAFGIGAAVAAIAIFALSKEDEHER